jgi:hypothetical protein
MQVRSKLYVTEPDAAGVALRGAARAAHQAARSSQLLIIILHNTNYKSSHSSLYSAFRALSFAPTLSSVVKTLLLKKQPKLYHTRGVYDIQKKSLSVVNLQFSCWLTLLHSIRDVYVNSPSIHNGW